MLITVIAIIIIVVFIIYVVSKSKPVPQQPTTLIGIHCEKCGSRNFRFLWDKQIVADDKHLEATPSGFSNSTSQYRGTSRGGSYGWSAKGFFGFGGHPRAHYNFNRKVHNGTSSSFTESYKYKEVSIKTFRISCKCKQCGGVWKETVSEGRYPEIKKIPTMK